MRHAGGQAGKRLGAAQAHRQLEDLQRVKEFECGGLAADDVEREGGSRAGALPREQPARRGSFVVVGKVMNLGDLGVRMRPSISGRSALTQQRQSRPT